MRKNHLYEWQIPLKPSRGSLALSPPSVPSAFISLTFSDRAWTGVKRSGFCSCLCDDSFPEWPWTFPRTSWCLQCSASGTEPASACLPGRWEHIRKTLVRLNINCPLGKALLVCQTQREPRSWSLSRKCPWNHKHLNFREHNSVSLDMGSIFRFLLFVCFYDLFLDPSIKSLPELLF